MSMFLTHEQLPSYIDTTPRVGLYLLCKVIVTMISTSKTDTEASVAVVRSTSCRDRQVLKVRALGSLGSTCGNHGERNSTLAYRRSLSFAEALGRHVSISRLEFEA